MTATPKRTTGLYEARQHRDRALERVTLLVALLVIFGLRYALGAIFGWPVDALDLALLTLGALAGAVISAVRWHRRTAKIRRGIH
jgi:hypothetical protein